MTEKRGRPTVMTAETLAKLEEAFLVGATDLQACFYAGIGARTLYEYQEENPEYAQRKAALKENLQFRAKKLVAQSLAEGSIPDARWYLEKRDPEFNPKQRLDHSSEDGTMSPKDKTSAVLAIMSEEQLKAALSTPDEETNG